LNLFGLSPGELILIMMVAMIVLGPEKLPEVMASAGKWVREFRRATQELTQQFADDNPFAEIQRALSFDGPIVLTPEASSATVETIASEPIPAPEPVASVGAPPLAPVAAPAGPVRSDYFNFPAFRSGIDATWTHAGAVREPQLAGMNRSRSSAIASDWTHGVPVLIVSAVVDEPTNGVAPIIDGLAVAGEGQMAAVPAEDVAVEAALAEGPAEGESGEESVRPESDVPAAEAPEVGPIEDPDAAQNGVAPAESSVEAGGAALVDGTGLLPEAVAGPEPRLAESRAAGSDPAEPVAAAVGNGPPSVGERHPS
jgi:sec-independent protein translocase protein TatB